jgi:Domain of unknown function (DUF4372)
MNQGQLVFSQLMAFLPLSTFRRCVAAHRGDHRVQDFTCYRRFKFDQFRQIMPIFDCPPPLLDKYWSMRNRHRWSIFARPQHLGVNTSNGLLPPPVMWVALC